MNDAERDPDISKAEAVDIAAGTKLAANRNAPGIRKFAELGKLGDQEPLYALGFAMALIGLISGNRRLRTAGVAVVAHVAAADLAKRAAKKLVKRTRPYRWFDHGHYEAGVGEAVDEKAYQSFPSGHVACTLAAADAVANVYPATRTAGVIATTFIALARLAKGAHWPLDIVGGLLIGWAATKAVAPLSGHSRQS